MLRHEAIDLLLRDPVRTGLFTDFDGTLCEIVTEPGLAQPLPGVSDALAALARRFTVVGVVSGRSLEDLRTRLAPDGVLLLGEYGRDRSDRTHPRTATQGWEAVGVAAVAATAGMPGVVVEHKGAGVALHYRMAPEHGGQVREIAASLADQFELVVLPGRLVAELASPGPDKGDAVCDLIEERGLRTVLYAGDDVADTHAFAKIGEAAECVLVAVASEEAPEQLLSSADLVLPGPYELAGFLGELAN